VGRGRNLGHLRCFGIAEDTGDPILDAVSTAWTEHFTPRRHRDMKSHVAKLCRAF
jgi:hypothetical protein